MRVPQVETRHAIGTFAAVEDPGSVGASTAGQIERRNRLIGRCRSMALRTGPHPRETLSINAPKMHLKLALLREARQRAL